MFKRLVAASGLLLGLLAPAIAADYPTRPIKFVVGFAPGGGTDLLARIVGDKLSAKLGQPVVVENKPGAAGAIAGAAVAQSPPDGYTLWIGSAGSISVAPYMQTPLPYDPAKDFTPISMLMTAQLQIFVRDDFPAKNFKEFVELIKANPGKYSFASAGTGGPGHMFAELIMREAGLKMVHVPYRGDGQAANDVLAGVIPVWATSTAAATPFIGPGKVRPIVTSGPARMEKYPDVPTAKESGYPQAVTSFYNVLLGPKGLPRDIVDKLNAAIVEIYKDPAVTNRIVESMGITPVTASPAETDKVLQDDIAQWRDIVAVVKKQQQ